MKIMVQILVLLMALVRGISQAPIAGVWQADANDLPAVTLIVHDDNGKLSGAIKFFFQQNENGRWTVTRQNTEPLVNPRLEGNVFSFEVSHARAHPGESGPADPAVKFTLTLNEKGEGLLKNSNYGGEGEVKLLKVQ